MLNIFIAFHNIYTVCVFNNLLSQATDIVTDLLVFNVLLNYVHELQTALS